MPLRLSQSAKKLSQSMRMRLRMSTRLVARIAPPGLLHWAKVLCAGAKLAEPQGSPAQAPARAPGRSGVVDLLSSRLRVRVFDQFTEPNLALIHHGLLSCLP